MKQKRVALSAAYLAVSAFAAASVVGLSANGGLHSERLCKPVVPQFMVTLKSETGQTDGYSLWMLFNEEGVSPFEWESFKRGARNAHCESEGNTCVGSRMRYEILHQGVGYQSVRIRASNADEKPRWIGGVRWYGPAYPDRVRVFCNVDEEDESKACELAGVEYTPNPKTSGYNGKEPKIGRHDQCQPKPTSIVAMAR